MSVPPRTPSWREIEKFCRIDGWRLIRETDHRFLQKVLPDGEVLETHTSFTGSGTMSQGRFNAILRTQLKVSREQFWKALQTRQPVDRPSPVEEAAPRHKLYVVRVLKYELGMSEEDIAGLSVEDAEQLVQEHWSRPRD